MRVFFLNVIKISVTYVRISCFKVLNSKARPQVDIILSDKKCLVHPKMSFTSQHAVNVIYNMWVLHQLSLKLHMNVVPRSTMSTNGGTEN